MTDFPAFVEDILTSVADFLWMPAVRWIVMGIVLVCVCSAVKRFLH